VKFLIVDDHPVTRLGVRQLILGRWPSAGVVEAETLAEAAQRFAEGGADAIVFDLQLPDAIGLDGVTRMVRLVRGVPILVLSQASEATYAARLMQIGARGYLQKDRSGNELVTALQRLIDGGRYVSATLADRLLDLLDGDAPSTLPHERLSAQEFRVMQLIAAGHTAAQIAQTMHLSVRTVGTYRSRIFDKTGWQSTAELSKYCERHGLAGT
jgi:two-component system, NarL family, invasion response regulator UvrY